MAEMELVEGSYERRPCNTSEIFLTYHDTDEACQTRVEEPVRLAVLAEGGDAYEFDSVSGTWPL